VKQSKNPGVGTYNLEKNPEEISKLLEEEGKKHKSKGER
jgi:hypothetical protein